jgi:hypothetical protein
MSQPTNSRRNKSAKPVGKVSRKTDISPNLLSAIFCSRGSRRARSTSVAVIPMLLGPIGVHGYRFRGLYCTVSVKEEVVDCTPAALAVTVTVDVEAVEAGDPLQPVNRLRPIALTVNRSSICRPRRFLKPRKHRATANVAPGNSGLELWRTAPTVAPVAMETVSVVAAAAEPDGVTVAGLKLHVALSGQSRAAERHRRVEPARPRYRCHRRPGGTGCYGERRCRQGWVADGWHWQVEDLGGSGNRAVGIAD